VLVHQRDLWADFRFAYGLSPAQALALPGPEYMALAWRTPAYNGVMAARLAEEAPDTTPGAPGTPGGPAEPRDVPLGSAGTVGADRDGLPMGDLFDIG
jgi:hypothetical protein